MRCRVFAFQQLDELVKQLVGRNLRQTSNPAEFRDTPAEKSDVFSETFNRRVAATRLAMDTLIYLISVGIVATATVGAFFGVAFVLLAHPRVEVGILADLLNQQVDAEVSPQRSDTFPPSDSSAAVPTESGSSSERAAESSDHLAAPRLSVPDWTPAIPPNYLRAHRHGRGARMTGTTADQLNRQELAGLLAGRSLPCRRVGCAATDIKNTRAVNRDLARH
jgi:hypothetical protein